MTPPWPLFLLVVVGQGIAALGAIRAWPLLRRMERDGLLKRPVPDLLIGNTDAWRTTVLLWATPIPPERRRLQRWIMVHRIAQAGSLALILAMMVGFSYGSAPSPPRHTYAAPTVDLQLDPVTQ